LFNSRFSIRPELIGSIQSIPSNSGTPNPIMLVVCPRPE
jgi:hypothetical protein